MAVMFDPDSMPEAARVADFYMNVIYRDRLPEAGPMTRFQAFCEHPVIFHVFHFGAAAYRDFTSNNSLDHHARTQMLMHKSESIRRLNDLLTNLEPQNVEIAIMTVLFLATNEVNDRGDSSDPCLLPLFPHLPYASWIGAFGRMKPIQSHADALEVLVERQGGLEALKMPGLGLNIARFDLRYASLTLTHPKFPSPWPIPTPILSKLQDLQVPLTASPGRGFRTIPGGLPPSLLSTLLQLAAINHLLSTTSLSFPTKSTTATIPSQNLNLDSARSATHHTLLSLPQYPCQTNESIRLTAILYSNAIISGLPPDTGWSQRLVGQIRHSIETSNFIKYENWLIWTLFLGGIASLDSPHRQWFVTTLRQVLRCSKRTNSWEEVVKEFLWSDAACKVGAYGVWDAVKIGLE